MDYLSFLTLRLESYPASPNFDRQDYMILNSVTNVSKALYPLGSYERIHCFFDNDRAGMEALRELQKEYGLRIRDASHIYAGDNDLNDYLRSKRFGRSEQQKKKPEPKEKERQMLQPKKKGRGIGM